MSLIKRISTSVYARVDRMVNGLENHDALVEAALRETRARVAAGKVRLERVRRDGAALSAKIEHLRQSERKWTERARQLADGDEATALECLRRRKRCEDERVQLQAEHAEHAERLVELEAGVRAAEEALGQRTQRYNLMRGRESAAEARQSLGRLSEDAALDVERIFERWETRVLESELGAEPLVGECTDRFERDLEKTETDDALRAELAALRQDKE